MNKISWKIALRSSSGEDFKKGTTLRVEGTATFNSKIATKDDIELLVFTLLENELEEYGASFAGNFEEIKKRCISEIKKFKKIEFLELSLEKMTKETYSVIKRDKLKNVQPINIVNGKVELAPCLLVDSLLCSPEEILFDSKKLDKIENVSE